MTAEALWQASGLSGPYEAWAFGEASDKLAELVLRGVKTATCSAFDLYEAEGEPLPKPGDYSVILDARGEAVCVIRTVKVAIAPFCQVTADHARREGEGDLSLAYWRQAHRDFLTRELASIHRAFHEDTRVVCEEFQLVYPRCSPTPATGSPVR